MGEKYRKERWVIEEILNKDCGLYKIRQEGHEAKIIHRKNIRPLKEGRNKTENDAEQVEDDNFDTITSTSEGDIIGGHDSNDVTEIDFETREDSEVEMPDMAEVLERFGIGTNRENTGEIGKMDNNSTTDERRESPKVRRSERLRNKNANQANV